MKPMEYSPGRPSGGRKEIPPSQNALEDFIDTPELYDLLLRIPRELRNPHLAYIEDLSDEEATHYLNNFIEKRENALRESVVNDESMKTYFDAHQEEIWQTLETTLFDDMESQIGNGQTAKVKRYVLEGADAPVKTVAVKYVVAPTEDTLSVDRELGLIGEVEQIQKIERVDAASKLPSKYMKVPHPYFYYKHGKIQSYGMEEIHGIDLQRATNNPYDSELKNSLRETFKNVDVNEIMDEVDRFFDVVHSVCLHQDVKPANLMVSREGKFYLIDFGQSAPTSHVDDRSRAVFEDHAESERKQAKLAIKEFLKVLNKD